MSNNWKKIIVLLTSTVSTILLATIIINISDNANKSSLTTKNELAFEYLNVINPTEVEMATSEVIETITTTQVSVSEIISTEAAIVDVTQPVVVNPTVSEVKRTIVKGHDEKTPRLIEREKEWLSRFPIEIVEVDGDKFLFRSTDITIDRDQYLRECKLAVDEFVYELKSERIYLYNEGYLVFDGTDEMFYTTIGNDMFAIEFDENRRIKRDYQCGDLRSNGIPIESILDMLAGRS